MDKLYIPGDLVSVYVGVKKYIVEVIGTEDENEVLSYQIKFPNGEIQYADKDNIVPIPLTPEILEKNGWDKEEKDGSVFSLSEAFMGGDEDDEDNYTCFQLYYQNKKDGWVIDMRGDPLKFEIHYIHELQHLLFGFGINHEMEV